jgi:hypothetical protein
MVSRDTAAGYGRDRHGGHTDRFHRLADRVCGQPVEVGDEPVGNVVVPHLDARLLSAGTTGAQKA